MMQQTGYHHMNMLVVYLQQDVSPHDTSMLAMVQELASVATENEESINNLPLSQTMNEVSQDTMAPYLERHATRHAAYFPC